MRCSCSCTIKIPILYLFFTIIVTPRIYYGLKNFFYKPLCCRTFDVITFATKAGVNFNHSALKWIDEYKMKNAFPPTGNVTYSINVCSDGEPHEGVYCSTQSCNLFGCNCDGSCFSNNKNLTATEMFRLKYGHLLSIESNYTFGLRIVKLH